MGERLGRALGKGEKLEELAAESWCFVLLSAGGCLGDQVFTKEGEGMWRRATRICENAVESGAEAASVGMRDKIREILWKL